MAEKRPTWSGDWPIPKVVRLPGCRARVKLVPGGPGGLSGAWVYDQPEGKATIFINADLPLPVQRYVLLHELQHALVELVDVGLEEFPADVMTKYAAQQAGLLAPPAPPEEQG